MCIRDRAYPGRVAVIPKGEVGSVVESIERVVFDVEAVLALSLIHI